MPMIFTGSVIEMFQLTHEFGEAQVGFECERGDPQVRPSSRCRPAGSGRLRRLRARSSISPPTRTASVEIKLDGGISAMQAAGFCRTWEYVTMAAPLGASVPLTAPIHRVQCALFSISSIVASS